MTVTSETPETANVVRYRDLREWIARVDALGELKRVNGARWQDEIGVICELNAKRPPHPALLFDDIPGYPSGFRILTAATNTAKRLALTLRLPATNTGELVSLMRGGRVSGWQRRAAEFAPEVVTDGPVFECVQEGAQVDLEKFPTPKWHEYDGGRYIGTGNAVITTDPDTGWANAGAYRSMITGKNQVSLWMASHNRHGRLHINKYWERGEPAPVVMTVGHDPLIAPIMAGMEIHEGISELSVAGAIMGEPLQVVRGPVTGLPIPAHSEIVLEGWLRQGVECEEGPHGEGTGYYAGGRHMVPAIEVAAVYHRRDPILLGAPPSKPPHDYSFSGCIMRSAIVHDALEAAGLPGVVRVWTLPWCQPRHLNVVVLKQRYFGHSKQAGLLAASVQPANYFGRVTIVVDDDIDPESPGELWWAITTRADPKQDYTILDRLQGSPIDPLKMTYPEGTMYSSRVVIDACKPFEHLEDFPRVVTSSPDLRDRVWEKWQHLFEQ